MNFMNMIRVVRKSYRYSRALILTPMLFTAMLSFSSASNGVTMEGSATSQQGSSQQNESSTRFLRGDLTLRTREGKIVTTVGTYQITAGVTVNDRRPMSHWFTSTTNAKISLEFNNDKLVSITIY